MIITVRKIKGDLSYHHEIKTSENSNLYKVTVENAVNPFKSEFIFIPNNITEELKSKFIKAIDKFENKYGETLSN